MAVTSIWPIKGRVDKVINYARNPEKTRERSRLSALHEIEGVIEYAADEMKTETREYVSCINLTSEETAAKEFAETKRIWKNEGGRVCYHGYQSFKADEVDADTAHNIGVALARELWGDRFQVVIATHCNTGHYHNHFVINSVSDIDGKKFYNSPADYRRMREVSDRLCREAGISVIENPERRGENYGQWMAEKNGKPTVSGMIRADIDRAIAASVTEREFISLMEQMGYRIYTRTPSGAERTHPVIKPHSGGKNYRLKTLGEEYTLEAIKRRILQNIRKKDPFPKIPEAEKPSYRRYREKAQKATGLYALYLYYCYELQIIKAYPTSVKRVSGFLREDVIKLDRYISQADFLGRTGITTTQELKEYKSEAAAEIENLSAERKELRNKLNRLTRSGDEEGIRSVKEQIADISSRLRLKRKEIGLCEDIAERSERVRQNLEEITRQKEKDRREQNTDELHIVRSIRTGRENDAEHR